MLVGNIISTATTATIVTMRTSRVLLSAGLKVEELGYRFRADGLGLV